MIERGRKETPWGINAVALLETLSAMRLPVDGATATIALQKYIGAFGLAPESERRMLLSFKQIAETATCIRTGGLFVFDPDDIPSPDRHEREDMPSALPPLPYQRCWLELMSTPEQAFFIDADGTNSFLLGWAIFEVDQGSHWHVVLTMLDQELIKASLTENGEPLNKGFGPSAFPSEAVSQRDYELLRGPDGKIAIQMAQVELDVISEMKEDWQLKIHTVLMVPEYLISLLHVLGVSLVPVATPRQQKRQFSRRYGYDYPQLYFVNLRGTGEAFPGHGEREYRHRWLVRGHYRRFELGEHIVAGKGPCTWVRPYVKGPVGAPWKGRPVYVA